LNIANVNSGAWPSNSQSKYFIDDFEALSFEDIKRSQFLSVIAGVGILFESTNNAIGAGVFSDVNSVIFWLESARSYNCGSLVDHEGNVTIGRTNYYVASSYTRYFSSIDKRYTNSCIIYQSYIDHLLEISR